MITGSSKLAYSVNGVTVWNIMEGDGTINPNWKITYFIRPDMMDRNYAYIFAFQWYEPASKAIDELYTLMDQLFPTMKNSELRRINTDGGSMGIGHIILGS